MKGFTPVLGPPEKPDPWWVRLFSYSVITVLIAAGSVAALFGFWIFYGGPLPPQFYEMSLEEQERAMVRTLQVAAGIGTTVGVGYCVWAEWLHQERMAYRRERQRRSAAREEI